MKPFVIASATLLTAGCATTIETFRDRPTVATYTSSRSPSELEYCLSGKLSWFATPSVIHGPDSTEISLGRAGVTFVLITVRAAQEHSTVEVRSKAGYAPRLRRNVEECAD